MGRLWAIAKYEYKMQVKRIAGWMVLAFVVAVAMMDCLPVSGNLARLEFIGDIQYYVRRIFSLDGLILLFGIFFLTAGRLVDDRKSGRRDLFMAAPVGRESYLAGKLAGNFLFAITLMYSLLIVSLFGFGITAPTEPGFADYMNAIFNVSVYIILPATFFVVASSVMLPEIVDIRLVYLLYSVLFLLNLFSTDRSEARPFYLLTQGDLAKMIWQHPKYPEIYVESACVNLMFMLGVGILAVILVAARRQFWRVK